MQLGLDIGTSGVKAVLVGEDGLVAAEASAPLEVSRPHPFWSEQDPADWWRATEAAVLALPVNLRAEVDAIGLAGQMHGAVLLDAADRVLRPAILWNDGRAGAECAELERDCPELRTIGGNAAMPGFTAPKLLWVRKHEPELFGRVAKVLLPKDHVRLLMTGEHATDLSDASGTLWLDVGARAWSEALLAATELGLDHMPRVQEGPEVTGTLRAEVASAWGMGRVPVVAGGGDNAAAAVGTGVTGPGEAFLSLGTSGVVFVADTAFRPAPDRGAHAFAHALPGRWHQMAVILSAASAVDWAARLAGFSDVAVGLAEANGLAPFAGRAQFLPYLSGERTPHNDPDAAGLLAGLTHATGRGELMLAAMEGVAFALVDGLGVLEEAGARIETLSVVGGGARSAAWGRILAAALGKPLRYGRDAHVGPAFGAARLARIGLGARVADVATAPELERMVEPDPALAAAAADKYARWRALYPAVRGLT